MKRNLILAAVLLVLTSPAASIANYNGSSGDAQITSTKMENRSLTQSNWSSSFSVTNKTSWGQDTEKISNVTWDGNKVSFNGVIQAPNPCYETVPRFKRTSEDSYRLEISLNQTGQMCTQQLARIDYYAELEAENPFSLEVLHEDRLIDTVDNMEKNGNEEKNFFSRVLDWFRNLF